MRCLRPFEVRATFQQLPLAKLSQFFKDGRNGAFLIRPAQKGEVSRPLTLSLLLNGEVFNVSIRKLKGTGHYALGKEKKDELVS